MTGRWLVVRSDALDWATGLALPNCQDIGNTADHSIDAKLSALAQGPGLRRSGSGCGGRNRRLSRKPHGGARDR